MGLKIIRNSDGTLRNTWHGRISVKGAKKTTNLNVPIAGIVPMDANGNVDIKTKGDAAFERSRKAAQKAFETWRKETQRDPAELQRKAHKARTGEDLEGLPLAKLFSNWMAVSRGKEPTADWRNMVKGWFDDFATFARMEARKHRQRCETANDVTPEIASAWFASIKAADSWETVLKKKHLLSGTFARLQGLGLSRINPFANMQLRGGGNGDNKKVSRRALTEAETEKLLDLAHGTALYPLIVTAVCTGLRIGDICNLTWDCIDFNAGLIDITTAKAHVRVTIPIFGRLREVLDECAPVSGTGAAASPFVFPEWARDYNYTNEKGHHSTRNKIIQAIKPLMARAVYGDEKAATDVGTDGETVRPLADALDETRFTAYKRNRLMDVYARYKAGERSIDIAAALDIARSQVSMDLREIEKLTGEELRPMATKTANRKSRLDLIDATRQERKIGQRAASVLGWHSCRHAFVVLAIKSGVPVEDVRLIVGHGEAETTLDNYYNPTKEIAAERMRKRMKGTVLDDAGSTRKAIEMPVDTSADGSTLAPVNGKAAAVRTLALARAVMPSDQAATVAAVLRAAGVDAEAEPKRALSLTLAALPSDTKARISDVIRAAGM